MDGGLGGAVDGVEADGDIAEAEGVKRMEAGFLSARRCGRTRRVRVNGAVRLVVISVAITVLEVAGSAKGMEFMMPALMKIAKRCGYDPRHQ